MRPATFITIIIILTYTAYGQESKTIKGITVEKTGTPIPNCSVSIKGTKIAATTNNCGEFEFVTVEKEFTIVFNCISTHDFTTFEKRINLQEINNGETVVFQLKRHGKFQNKECIKGFDKRLRKIKV